MSTFRTCPDCGGILQSGTPDWIGTADIPAGAGSQAEPVRWQCLLCGYEEDAPDTEFAAGHARTLPTAQPHNV